MYRPIVSRAASFRPITMAAASFRPISMTAASFRPTSTLYLVQANLRRTPRTIEPQHSLKHTMTGRGSNLVPSRRATSYTAHIVSQSSYVLAVLRSCVQIDDCTFGYCVPCRERYCKVGVQIRGGGKVGYGGMVRGDFSLGLA